jgi:hypothetical protein
VLHLLSRVGVELLSVILDAVDPIEELLLEQVFVSFGL